MRTARQAAGGGGLGQTHGEAAGATIDAEPAWAATEGSEKVECPPCFGLRKATGLSWVPSS